MGTLVYKFGAKAPVTHGEIVNEHFYRASRYRNDLCALELRRREQVEATMRRFFPGLAELDARIDAIDAEIATLRASIKSENAIHRQRRACQETKDQIDRLAAERREQYQHRKVARAAAFGPDELKEARSALRRLKERIQRETRKRDVSAHPEFLRGEQLVRDIESRWFESIPGAREFQQAIEKVETEHRTASKELRAACGVHFGTYLAVEAAAKKFRAGAPPRFKPYRGEGSVGVQLPPDKPNTIDTLLGKDVGQFAIDGYSPGCRHAVARIRIGTDDDGAPIWTKIPTKFHRDIPADARIKWAYLVRRKVGAQYRYWLQLTLDRDRWQKPNLATSGVVAVDVGWRLVDGGMRVAYWVGSDGREGEVVIPTKLLDRFHRCDEIRSERDRRFNTILPQVVDYVRELLGRNTAPQWLIDRTHKTGGDGVSRFTLPHWRATAKLAALVLQWRENRIAGDDEIYAAAEAWRRQDKLDLDRQEHGRQKAIGWRNEIYRVFCARLRTEYRTVIVEQINWRQMQRRPEPERDDEPRLVGEFRIAAVGSLVELLSMNMGELVRKDPSRTSMTCPGCGQLSGEPKPEKLMHGCSHCGGVFDQDRGAALNLLGSHRPNIIVE